MLSLLFFELDRGQLDIFCVFGGIIEAIARTASFAGILDHNALGHVVLLKAFLDKLAYVLLLLGYFSDLFHSLL